MESARVSDVSPAISSALPRTRAYQQELLNESLRRNVIIALDTGSGKTHIAVLRMKIEVECRSKKVCWFLAPTVALCEQQRKVIATALPVTVRIISGVLEPEHWKSPALWKRVLNDHRIVVSTPQVLLDAMRHGYVNIGRDVSLLVFDEAHHAVRDDPYNRIMKEFYFFLPPRPSGPPSAVPEDVVMRPAILGLTASPIYRGKDLERDFRSIEANLDSVIRSSRLNRDELSRFVHKPVFKYALYAAPTYDHSKIHSTNLEAVLSVVKTMDIENDPYVKSLRRQLSTMTRQSPEWQRADQQLSKTIRKKSSYTHRGLNDLYCAAEAIYDDAGPWAADWYVEKVIKQAQSAYDPFDGNILLLQDEEKRYLMEYVVKIEEKIVPVSYFPESIVNGVSDKVEKLIKCLLEENERAMEDDEMYRGLVFVTRRDTVLAVAEILSHHPDTSTRFSVGCLLGSSETAYRQTFLDITRKLVNRSQSDTLAAFDAGVKNVIVATSVAEEGIDIQACGSVIRWDPPPNMVSWAQSRGRARRVKSTFTVLIDDSGIYGNIAAQWSDLEQRMTELYISPDRGNESAQTSDDKDDSDEDEDEDALEFRVESTGAVLSIHSAVSHLHHFCTVLPNSAHGAHLPLYDLDPPDFPEGWHLSPSHSELEPYEGPWGCTVTLPRMLPSHLRVFSVPRKYGSKQSAYRHAAFNAYLELYKVRLLNDRLLPLTSVLEPELEPAVLAMLQDVEKRSGTADVAGQLNPWLPSQSSSLELWYKNEVIIGDLPVLYMFTRVPVPPLASEDQPVLYMSRGDATKVLIQPQEKAEYVPVDILEAARKYTRNIFWSVAGARIEWDNLNFSYVFLPSRRDQDQMWNKRRAALQQFYSQTRDFPDKKALFSNAEVFTKLFGFPDDISIVRTGERSSRVFRFLRWQFEDASETEHNAFQKASPRFADVQFSPPFLVVQAMPLRMNFLALPASKRRASSKADVPVDEKPLLFLPHRSFIDLLSSVDAGYALFLPSILRYLTMAMTTYSLRSHLLTLPLHDIPLKLLMTAITSPVTQEHFNYERLETLGDTVLKFCTGIHLLSEYPLWHEGYLSRRKDHAVANVRLAKDAVSKQLYRWIIRDRFVPRKWQPDYAMSLADPMEQIDELPTAPADPAEGDLPEEDSVEEEHHTLSTKVLADVVESLIGAAYLKGSFDLAIHAIKLFGLGIQWDALPAKIEQLQFRVPGDTEEGLPSQLELVERMLGYEFKRKLLLVEALTHASYHGQSELSTISYERMEFLGDSVLDMIVTEELYHAEGKEYSPGHLHMRKAAVVNKDFLAFICLRCSVALETCIPKQTTKKSFVPVFDRQDIYLWQCLLHSSHQVLDNFKFTFTRFQHEQAGIEEVLAHGPLFPWAALTRLQAPKLFSDLIESLMGAVYLDSSGGMDVVRGVLTKLGILPTLRRLIRDDVDVLHPLSRVSNWVSGNHKEIEYLVDKKDGKVACIIKIDGVEEARAETKWEGKASQEQVKFAAAEILIQKMRALKGVSTTAEVMLGSDQEMEP